MQSKILKIQAIKYICFLVLLIINCNGTNDVKNQITITINSIDKKTKKRRVNVFDTVEVRREGIGYLMKTFTPVGKYVTDSTGSVKIKIDSSKICDISIYGLDVLGGDMFYPGYLKNGQEVNIEVF